MEIQIAALLSFVDLRFATGLFVGIVLTLRYVVIGIYHPIIRDQMNRDAARGRPDDKPD